MTHGTEHHLEEAEHVKHAAHDPFDKRVAMTMAIVAAALACVTMLSHRAHNQTLQLQNEALREQSESQTAALNDKNEALRLQGEALRLQNEALRFQADANRLQTDANIRHTQASDQWSYFQAKKNRQYLYESCAELMSVLAKDAGNPSAVERSEKLMTGWKGKAKEYRGDTKKIEEEARALEQAAAKFQAEAQAKQAASQSMQLEAQKKLQEAHAKQLEAQRKQEDKTHAQTLDKSHEAHARGDRYDLSELAVEFALVLCSVAVLSKLRGFWYTGIVFGMLGVAVALSGWLNLFMQH
jgi:hypothetical protein